MLKDESLIDILHRLCEYDITKHIDNNEVCRKGILSKKKLDELNIDEFCYAHKILLLTRHYLLTKEIMDCIQKKVHKLEQIINN